MSKSRPSVLQFTIVTTVVFTLWGLPAGAAQLDSTLSPELRQKVDLAATEVIANTGIPGASVAIVKDGRIAYLQAYGNARLESRVPAKPEMRYSVGSISKQFTAAAVLLLQEQGKLSLDDKVGRFLPTLTRSNEVTIRQLLSHTSGYQDFWPQDYVPDFMLRPVTAEQIMDEWSRKPLDFDPGTKWQYSNTNYVIAGVIVEKVSGIPLLQFLEKRVFAPLAMNSVANVDQENLGEGDPLGYTRYGLGPLRPAPKTGEGWLFAAGELAMSAADLARWDISLIEQKLLKPTSYNQLATDVLLKNGLGTQYGLGIIVRQKAEHRVLEHSGEVSGYTAQNVIFPDDRAAIAVLVNQDATDAPEEIASKITPLMFVIDDAAKTVKLEQTRKIFVALQQGLIDRSLFTANANHYFTEPVLKDFASSLSSLGAAQEFTQTAQQARGGMTMRLYHVKFAQKTLMIVTYEVAGGKLEQYLVTAE